MFHQGDIASESKAKGAGDHTTSRNFGACWPAGSLTGGTGTYRKRKYRLYLRESGYGSCNPSPSNSGQHYSGQNDYGHNTSGQYTAGHSRSYSGQNNHGRSNPNQPSASNSGRDRVRSCYNCGATDHINRMCGKAKKKDSFVPKLVIFKSLSSLQF